MDWSASSSWAVVLCILVDFRIVVVDKPIHVVPGELRCPRCFGKDIVHSMPRGWYDAAMRLWGRVPRHCRFCGCRFHVRGPGDEAHAAGGSQTGLGKDR
jgi:hypothetical protein